MLIELKNGKRKDFKPALAKVLIARGLGKEVHSGLQYQTRAMQAVPANQAVDAPYGLKADGTPKKRPGRPAVSE